MPRLTDEDRENLVAYLDGELDAKTSRDLETKLNLDAEARAEADAMRQAWGLLDYLPRAQPSPSFTHRTLERLALQTGAMGQRTAPRKWTGVAWAVGVLLALGVGFSGARYFSRAEPNAAEIEEIIVRHPRAVDKVWLLEKIDDVNFLRELDHSDLFGDEPVETRAEQVGKREEPSAATQDRLHQNAVHLLSLPAAQRARIFKLEEAIEKMPAGRRESIEKTLGRYAAWLDELGPEERKRVQDAVDSKARLEIIRQLRAQEWLRRQPAAVRQEVANLPADKRAEKMEALRGLEHQRKLDWLIASRFWNELARKQPLPARLEDFPARDLPHFVNDYLKPFLSAEEWSRLHAAEGTWPAFPRTLVALADAHPLALPGPRGPVHVQDLPAELRRRLVKTNKNKKEAIPKPILREEGRWPDFAVAVTKYAGSKQSNWPIFPFELWPQHPKALSHRVSTFIEKELRPALDTDEQIQLLRAETHGGWPEFPQTIDDLARKHDLHVPWHSLPGSEEYWDKYRWKPRAALNK